MTADNLNNVRVIPDLLVINENVRPSKVAYRQFDDKSKTWIGVTWKEFADMVRSWRKAFTASGLKKATTQLSSYLIPLRQRLVI